jgi:hypothetical protein
MSDKTLTCYCCKIQISENEFQLSFVKGYGSVVVCLDEEACLARQRQRKLKEILDSQE